MTERERWREIAREMHVEWPPNAVEDFHAACRRIAALEAERDSAMRLAERTIDEVRAEFRQRLADLEAENQRIRNEQCDGCSGLSEEFVDEWVLERKQLRRRVEALEAMHDAQRDRIRELTKALAQQLDANARILKEREQLRSENHRLMTCIKQTMRDQGGDDA